MPTTTYGRNLSKIVGYFLHFELLVIIGLSITLELAFKKYFNFYVPKIWDL